jgi:Signal transduction histidine kinase
MIKPRKPGSFSDLSRFDHVQTLDQMSLVVASIAHDFNNVLATIVGNVELLKLDSQPESASYRQLEEIANAAQFASYLSKQLMGWSNQQLPVTGLNLNVMVSEVVQMTRSLFRSNIELQLQLKQNLPLITANATQIKRMIWNLLHNAVEACAHSEGKVLIQTDTVQFERNQLQSMDIGSECPAGLYVLLGLQDNGSGMDALLQKRIFDPFFTTKTSGHGLGLSVVIEGLRLYSGALKLESTIGQGTSFQLYFPVY